MTKVYFENGGYIGHEGSGQVNYDNNSLELNYDDFMLIGTIGISKINIFYGSLDAKNAKIINNFLFVNIFNSKVENINNASWTWLSDNSSLSNSSTNELVSNLGINTIDGVVSAKEVKFSNSSLKIAKNGVLKVPDKNALKFEKIFGEGKVFDEKTQTYYNTNGVALNNAKDSLVADIIKYDFAIAKEIKEQKEAYINVDESQNTDVALLNIEAINNDNFL